ncbi:zonular occludens toxin domain-containing protein [Pseudomonas sp. PDM33]|uniref:zonular occludens toxin domain-containing protein n=1 Tax=Pseudomonas sp. PDM33 TaxID=2854765 RepID=UPI001C45DACF|nr:zonular occludens toxin domain-containing protein [Pseudomonas sp. PDM33]MBV7581686.1 zonular occludens toxin domain-containing protein [Pseudomonas sp. PDM33]
MLYIRTGKPGHGKTLNTIREVDAKAKAEGRIVYFHNVAGLKPEKLEGAWFEFEDPFKWYELPQDAIIVVDEAQGWFGARDPRNRPPEHITRFETMRHQGHEVHLVTQDPRYIDVHLRRLCNGHIHYWRVFKSQQLLRFESESVIEAVEKKTSFKDADKTVIKLDKKYFRVYTSTQAQHHFKFKPPKKMVLALAVIIGAGFMVYRAFERYQQGAKPVEAATAATQPTQPGMVDQAKSMVGSLISPSGGDAPKPVTPEQYIEQRKPRIADLPASAPVYDQLTTPVSKPRIYCLSTSDPRLVERRPPETVKDGQSCQCYTQQATKFATSFEFCLSVARNGYFDPTLPDRGIGPDARMAQQPPPGQAFPTNQSTPSSEVEGTRVTVIPYEKGRFLW